LPSVRRLVIGLGNPGPEYAETRHNAGFMLADRVARRAEIAFSPGRGPFVAASGVWNGTRYAVAKTAMTYMNHSGTPVRALVTRFGLEPQDVLVAYDDLALEIGQIRLRRSGGAGGHNGMQDIIDKLGTDSFPRLRIGIGSSFARGRQSDYVLGPFSEEQWPAVDEALDRGAEAALTFVHEGVAAAMNRYNKR
jgi:peptidyl-tRNA hydrolase, PTH1 family